MMMIEWKGLVVLMEQIRDDDGYSKSQFEHSVGSENDGTELPEMMKKMEPEIWCG